MVLRSPCGMTYRGWQLAAAAWLWSASVAIASPVCAFSPEGAPAWITCGSLDADASDAALRDAAARSRATGFTWVLQIGHHVAPHLPAGPVAARARQRAEAAGLWPHVAAVTYGEEWHERCFFGEFAAYGLTANAPECPAQVVGWMSQQHAAVKAATDKPIVWITHFVHPTRPVPAHTAYVALDPYPTDDQDFAFVEWLLALSADSTDLPLVIIPRWFQATGPFQGRRWQDASRPPSQAVIDGYARWARHPRVVALWGFLWASRPYADLVGLADMPATRAAVERSLGVR